MDDKRDTVRWLGVLVTALAAAMMVPPQPASASCGSWKKAPSPPVRNGVLWDVSASSPTDAWAVGIRYATRSGETPLTEHWDGHSWTRVPSDRPHGFGFSSLNAVVAIAPDDAWAVGAYSGKWRSWMQHWDGTAWHRAALPASVYRATFTDLAAASSHDVWAVGNSRMYRTPRILHYDGHRWKLVHGVTPHSPDGGFLLAVSAVSPGDVWAVGADSAEGDYSLIERWDGTTWTRVPTPQPQLGLVVSVVATSHTDAWATTATKVEHWDGTRWTIWPTTKPLEYAADALAASGQGDVWAIGGRYVGGFAPSHWGLATAHWNGTAWTATLYQPTKPTTHLLSVAHVPASANYWAVGGTRYWRPAKPLIYGYCP